MEVKYIEKQGTRRILYGDDLNYYVISTKLDNVKIGDIIDFEPYAIGFGFYKQKQTGEHDEKDLQKKSEWRD